MTGNPICINADKKIGEAEEIMRLKHINALVVKEEDKVVGILPEISEKHGPFRSVMDS